MTPFDEMLRELLKTASRTGAWRPEPRHHRARRKDEPPPRPVNAISGPQTATPRGVSE